MKKLIISAGLILSFAFIAPVSAATCTNLSGTLSAGSRSSQVTALQNFLVSQNYSGGGNWMITGYYGKATVAAVSIFQQQHGLPQTGVVDSATASAITNVSCGYSNSYNNSNPSYSYPGYPGYQGYSYPYNGYTNYNNPFYPYGTTPVITSLSQNTGSAGNTVTIYGTGFDPVNNTVNFGSQPIYGIPSDNGTSITFTIPAYYSGTTYSLIGNTIQLSVSDSRGSSNSETFTLYGGYGGCGTYPYNVYPYSNSCTCGSSYYNSCQPSNPNQLSLQYLTPTYGAVGTAITVYGTGFTATGNTVHFGSGVIANLISPDGRSVSFNVPSNLTGYGSQPVTVGTYQVSAVNGQGVSSNALPFSVTSTISSGGSPLISQVTGPTSLSTGVQGTWTLTMSNPSNAYASVSVNWGDTGNGYVNMAAPQTTYQAGTQTMNFTHAYIASGTYQIVFTVANQSGQTNTYATTIYVSGSGTNSTNISYISPSIANVGQQIAIMGSGFSLYGNTVHFGVGGTQNVPSYNGTTLYFTIPSAVSPCDVLTQGSVCAQYLQQVTPGQYQIYVTNNNGITNTVTVTVQ